MITGSGEQNDKEVLESSFARLMQMYMFVTEVLQESKYHYPGLRWHTSAFSLSVQLLRGRARKVWYWQLTRGPLVKGSQKWVQLVGMFTNQNQNN